MKLINQSAEIWEQEEGKIGIYKAIERAARLCYKSEDKITDDSYKRFIGMLNTNGHLSPFEHGTVYLAFHRPWSTRSYAEIEKYILNPYSRVSEDVYDKKVYRDGERQYSTAYVTTNYRVIKENGWEEDLKYLCEPTEYHTKRVSIHITTSIGISRELNRHRCHSICEESTRYCNYSKDKFGNDITFVLPPHIKLDKEITTENEFCLFSHQFNLGDAKLRFLSCLIEAKLAYLRALQNGWKPQQARDILPLATKTELVHTAYIDDWNNFIKLRSSSFAHPMMQELAHKIDDLIKNNLF